MKTKSFKRFLFTAWWSILAIAGLGTWASIGKADDTTSRLKLRITGSWVIEVAVSNPVNGVIWKTETSGVLAGGAFIQTLSLPSATSAGCLARKTGDGTCKRLTIFVDKPQDQIATLKLQFPGRTQGITAPVGALQASITLPELSLDDFGLASLQLTVMGATNALFGVFNLSTFAVDDSPATQPSASVDGNALDLQTPQVKAGWHWFLFGPGKRLDVVEDPNGLLSLCAFSPEEQAQCSSGNTLSVWVKHKGLYMFEAWDKTLAHAVYLVEGI